MATPASMGLLKQQATLEATAEDLPPPEAETMFEAKSRQTIEAASFCFHTNGLPMTILVGHMPVDTAAGHPACGRAYFQALESGLNAFKEIMEAINGEE